MKRNKKRTALFTVLVAILFFIVIIILLKSFYEDPQSLSEDSPVIMPFPTPGTVDTPKNLPQNDTESTDLTTDQQELPSDKLFITVERQNYQSGDLNLIIPKLKLSESIEDGTQPSSLNKGPGLYEYSQLPGDGNRNVSIAAHRNTSRNGVIGVWFFYYIDTLTTGDYLYLVDDEHIYRYSYDQTTVVDPYNWGPIYSQGFSCLTLTSCEPIGISTHRIIVRSKLSETFPYTKDFEFTSHDDAIQ